MSNLAAGAKGLGGLFQQGLAQGTILQRGLKRDSPQQIAEAEVRALQAKEERREFEILLARGENPGTPRTTNQRTTAQETTSRRKGSRASLFGTQAGVTTRKLGGGI